MRSYSIVFLEKEKNFRKKHFKIARTFELNLPHTAWDDQGKLSSNLEKLPL